MIKLKCKILYKVLKPIITTLKETYCLVSKQLSHFLIVYFKIFLEPTKKVHLNLFVFTQLKGQ